MLSDKNYFYSVNLICKTLLVKMYSDNISAFDAGK